MAVKGLGGQLHRNSAPTRRSRIVAAMQQSAGESVSLPLADISPNPANPPARETEDLTGLVESIREVGIVQALTVVPAAEWLEHHPEHADAVGDKDYVLLAGHRRRAAGLLAEQTHAPVMIRPDLASTGVADVQLHENLHRLALTPIQEARAYQAKVDEGFSQRQIAAAVKVSQGQINKRLALLQLPESVQVAVDQGWYSVADALGLLKLDPEVIEEVGESVSVLTNPDNMLAVEASEEADGLTHAEALASRARTAAGNYQLRLSEVTRGAQVTVEARRRRAIAQAKADELGAKLIESPREKFKGSDDRHRLYSERDIARHAKNGNLAVAPGFQEEPRYYALAVDNKASAVSPDEAARQDAEKRKAKARREGHKARVAAITQLVRKRPGEVELRRQLVRHVLEAPSYDSRAKELARHIAVEAGIGPSDTEGYYSWMREVAAAEDRATRELLAWVLVWAARERQHQDDTPYASWRHASIAYFDDLIAAGYVPGEWEREELEKGRNALQREAEAAASDAEGSGQQ